MTDPFAHQTRSPADPATSVFDITPDDGTDLPSVATALNVATPGTVRVTLLDGATAELTVQSGQAFPVRAVRVWLTGTTATGIRGMV